MDRNATPPAALAVTLSIDGATVTVPAGTLILEAARAVGSEIPTLCQSDSLPPRAVCRLCLVECDGASKLKAACATPVWEGARVVTVSPALRRIRQTILELILSDHPPDCLTCPRNLNCELQLWATRFGIRALAFPPKGPWPKPIEDSGALVRDMSKCVKCGRCVSACQDGQEVGALTAAFRAGQYEIVTPFRQALLEGPCVHCGECAAACPVGAIAEKDESEAAFRLLEGSNATAAIFSAETLAGTEDFLGYPPGSVTPGNMVAALKRLGFFEVLDRAAFARLAARVEAEKLSRALERGGTLPLIAGCAPTFRAFVSARYPEALKFLSNAISPESLFAFWMVDRFRGAPLPRPARAVSFQPCLARKLESRASAANQKGGPAVDLALTARELARTLRRASFDLRALPATPFDPLVLGPSLTLPDAPAASPLAEALYAVQREGEKGRPHAKGPGGALREFYVDFKGEKLLFVLVFGIQAARKVLERVLDGSLKAAYVKIMSCPKGCLGGGGQALETLARLRMEENGAGDPAIP